MNLKYNYAAAACVLVLFTWAALTPEDDGFNTLLRTNYDDGDEEDDDDMDDDEGYVGPGYEGRDKAVASKGDGVIISSGAGGSGSGGGRDISGRD